MGSNLLHSHFRDQAMNKILIVDDQEQNLYLLKSLLGGHGYQVIQATNGAEALGLAKIDPPHMIISDILMPVMDGFSLCQEWKKDQQLKNIPFVFYTATYTDPKDEELALSLGAARFIIKPVETEEFISIIEQVISEVESGVLAVHQESRQEDVAYYRMYNESLIRKLEDKMLELEKVNRALEEDMAKRKRAEEELQRQRDFAVQVMNAMGQGLAVTGLDGSFEYVNPAGARMIGRSPEELIGKSPEDVIDEEGHQILANALAQRLAGETSTYEIKLLHMDGRKVDALITGAPRWSEGRVIGAIGVITDLTVLKRAEGTLRESEERFRSLSEAAFEGIMIHDQGVILNANQAFADLFSYRSPEDLIGKDGLDALTFAPESRELIRGNLSSGLTEPLEIMVMRPDGSMFPAETQGRDITINGRKLRVIAMRDITKRKQAEAEITRLFEESQRRLKQVETLHSIDLTISASMDLRMTLNILLKHVESLLNVDAADILLLVPNSQHFNFSAGRGFRTHSIERASARLGASFAGRAALERNTVVVSGELVARADGEFSKLYEREGFSAYAGAPLLAKGQIKGVLEVYHRSAHKSEPEWLNLLETLAGQAALAIDSAQLFNDLQLSNLELTLAYDATIAGWSRAMDLRDKETEGHTQRVTDLTLKLARSMGIGDAQLTHIRHGALLHDIGKMGVPDNILLKADKLTNEEWEKMRKHPDLAYDMLSSIRYLQPALDIPYCHHEKWDGSGYPRGLKGEEIPIAARIFAVADVWDAITSDRPYRKGWSKEEALEYIKEQSGQYFDPQVVEEFLSLISDTSIQI